MVRNSTDDGLSGLTDEKTETDWIRVGEARSRVESRQSAGSKVLLHDGIDDEFERPEETILTVSGARAGLGSRWDGVVILQ